MHVLIAEDNKIERMALEKLFSMYYGNVFTTISSVSNGERAIEHAKKYYCDLLMLDINMPEKDGLEVLQEINATSPNTKCIMVTAYSDFEYMQTAIRENAFDYLLKPYSIDTFKKTIDRFLDHYWHQEKYGVNSVVSDIRQFIVDNYMNQVTLQDVADHVGMDKSYIGRIFKKEFGVGIIEYLNQYRLNKAEELLTKGMSVAETAECVGYDDPAYFGKCFKKMKGYSPSNVGKKIDN